VPFGPVEILTNLPKGKSSIINLRKTIGFCAVVSVIAVNRKTEGDGRPEPRRGTRMSLRRDESFSIDKISETGTKPCFSWLIILLSLKDGLSLI